MGGPQYDLLMNPLGAVRQTFEKVVASSQPSDVDPTAVYRGKDWGIVGLLNQYLFDQGGLAQVPILDASSQKWVQPNTLVRFRGMVQDMLGNELYIGAFKDGCTWRTNKFIDFSPFSVPPVSETTLWERHLFHCIPVPGQNSWAIESTPYPLKRSISNEMTCHHGEKRRRDDNPNKICDSHCCDESSSSNKKQVIKKKSPIQTLSFPAIAGATKKDSGSASRHRIAEINNGSSFPTDSFSCLVKVYDMPECQFKLNEVVEFIGIYTFDPELIASNNKEDVDDDMMIFDFMDDVATHLPPSKVPRIHCLVSRKLSTLDLISNSLALEPSLNIMRGVRDSLVSYLSCTLGNDVLAAQCLLLHLLSKLRTKSDVASVGRLSLNLTGFTQETASIFGYQLHNVIKTLLPYSHTIPLTIEYLNTAMLQPKKDNQTGRLVMGALQLAIGTHLTFDETVMQSGTLNSKGVENVQLLKHLMENQTVEYDFQFYKLEMAAEVQCLIISESKSNILPADLVVPMCPSAVTPVIASEEQLHAWRWYLATVRSLPHLTDTSICEMLQNEMVDAMREDRSLGCADLSRWLTMAQLMAASFGEKSLSVDHWQMVKEMERLRKER